MEPMSRGAGRRIYVALKQLFLCSVAAVCIAVVIVVVPDWWPDTRPAQLSRDNPPSPASFAPQRMVSQQPPITELKVIAANEVQDEVEPDELVLGIVIDGEARAYPINGLSGPSREIYNDSLAGRPIAATW